MIENKGEPLSYTDAPHYYDSPLFATLKQASKGNVAPEPAPGVKSYRERIRDGF